MRVIITQLVHHQKRNGQGNDGKNIHAGNFVRGENQPGDDRADKMSELSRHKEEGGSSCIFSFEQVMAAQGSLRRANRMK